jgi:hypothetical protein
MLAPGTHARTSVQVVHAAVHVRAHGSAAAAGWMGGCRATLPAGPRSRHIGCGNSTLTAGLCTDEGFDPAGAPHTRHARPEATERVRARCAGLIVRVGRRFGLCTFVFRRGFAAIVNADISQKVRDALLRPHGARVGVHRRPRTRGRA